MNLLTSVCKNPSFPCPTYCRNLQYDSCNGGYANCEPKDLTVGERPEEGPVMIGNRGVGTNRIGKRNRIEVVGRLKQSDYTLHGHAIRQEQHYH